MDPIKEMLSARGWALREQGINAFALRRADTLTILELAANTGVTVLGGDVYRRDGDRATPTYDNWYCEITEGENAGAFQARSVRAANDFVRGYGSNDPDDDAVYFVLVMKGRSGEVY